MADFRNIVILTGARLSAESGLATFRDKDGIWAKYDYREVATPEGFRANPRLVHEFYNQRRRGLKGVAPNAAHLALARLEREHKGTVSVVTQNIDPLHEAAGTRNLIHMHGELLQALCALCEARRPWAGDLDTGTVCAACGKSGGMRPDVVWFGEMPYEMDRIYELLARADLFLSIGHQRQRLSRRRLRRGGAGKRRAYGGAQPRALGGRQSVPRDCARSRDAGRARLCGPAACVALIAAHEDGDACRNLNGSAGSNLEAAFPENTLPPASVSLVTGAPCAKLRSDNGTQNALGLVAESNR